MQRTQREIQFAGPKGFTLAEALIASVVLSIAVLGILLPFSSGAAVRAEGVHRTLAAKLAADLTEQVINKPFHDPNDSSNDYNLGPEAGEITNIDDFDGYNELQGQVKDANGVVFTDDNYANFSREVSCEYVDYMLQPSGGAAKPNFIKVTVRVYYLGREMASITRLISE